MVVFLIIGDPDTDGHGEDHSAQELQCVTSEVKVKKFDKHQSNLLERAQNHMKKYDIHETYKYILEI